MTENSKQGPLGPITRAIEESLVGIDPQMIPESITAPEKIRILIAMRELWELDFIGNRLRGIENTLDAIYGVIDERIANANRR